MVPALCSLVVWSRLLFKTGSLDQVAQDLSAFWVCPMSVISPPLWAPRAPSRAMYAAAVERGAKHSSHVGSTTGEKESL